jgi:hypothetical protein
MMDALKHPFGVTLILLSLGLAVAMVLIDALEEARGWAPVVVGIGVFGYLVSAVAVSVTRPTPRSPEMRRLDSVRRMIKSKFNERKGSEKRPYSPLTRTLGEAHSHLDRRIMPAIEELLEKQKQLAFDLKSFEDGTVDTPDAGQLERLKRMHSRRKATIEECVQQASNSASTLIEMLQTDQSDTVAIEAAAWARRILDTYEAIELVMRGAEEREDGDDETEISEPLAGAASVLTAKSLYDPLQRTLRRLNPATNLIDCELMGMLPCLVQSHCIDGNSTPDGSSFTPTPIEKAQAVRAVIVEAIETMRPQTQVSISDPVAMHYVILNEQYIIGRSVAHIIVRLSIAETAYYRHRRKAIEVLATELVEMELRCSENLAVSDSEVSQQAR